MKAEERHTRGKTVHSRVQSEQRKRVASGRRRGEEGKNVGISREGSTDREAERA